MEEYMLSAVVHRESRRYTRVASQGKTVEDALKNPEEAVELHMEEFC